MIWSPPSLSPMPQSAAPQRRRDASPWYERKTTWCRGREKGEGKAENVGDSRRTTRALFEPKVGPLVAQHGTEVGRFEGALKAARVPSLCIPPTFSFRRLPLCSRVGPSARGSPSLGPLLRPAALQARNPPKHKPFAPYNTTQWVLDQVVL